jgi:phosphoesterase RecJ-like protein
MEIAANLMATGIDFGFIIDDSYYTRTYAQQQVMGRVLMESLMIMDRRCLAGWLTMKDMRFYNVTSRDIDGIVSIMRETRDIDCALFIYEVSNQTYKVSLRSNNEQLDVAKVAAAFGGGGHKMAAGCSLQGSYYDVINNVTKELSKQMDSENFISNRK